MRMRDAKVGTVLSRTDENGDIEAVKVISTLREARYLPVGFDLDDNARGFTDVEARDDWQPVDEGACRASISAAYPRARATVLDKTGRVWLTTDDGRYIHLGRSLPAAAHTATENGHRARCVRSLIARG